MFFKKNYMTDFPTHFKGPKLNPIKVNPNFFERNPKVARVLQITAVVLGIIALLSGIVLIIGTPLGAPISMILGGCLLASGGALFVGGTIATILQARNSYKKAVNQKKLSEPLMERPELKALDYSLDLKEVWDLHHSVVKHLKKLDLNLSKTQREVLNQIKIDDEGPSLGECAAMISENYDACLKMLAYREELLKEQTQYQETRFNQNLTHRNKVLLSILSRITDNISKAGGVFSLKFSTLSSRMSRIHTTTTVILALSAVVSVMVVAALIPGGILALPILLAVAISAGVIVTGLSYLVRQILSNTKRNRQDFYKDFVKNVDIELLNQTVTLQRFLFEMLKGVLKEEEEVSLEGQDWYTQYITNAPIEKRLIEEIRVTYKEIDAQTKKMKTDLEFLENEVRSGRLSVASPSEDPSETPIFTQGKEFAKLRRQTSQNISTIYGPDNENIDPEFSLPWMPKKEEEIDHSLEPVTKLEPGSREELLLVEGVNPTLRELNMRIALLQQQLSSVRKWRHPRGEHYGNVIYSDTELDRIQMLEGAFYNHLREAQEEITQSLGDLVDIQNRILGIIVEGDSDSRTEEEPQE
ncbi:Uncharacterized protein CPn_0065/CP_0709/CPj0065/CpB0066 [Chlamydia pneumoniae]|uniref:Uncharacterized protein CPn_0065/CP_0709/CPj0065/CpB0066 n=3 Tax=Chlamydia pneumoniae TaxID=83558 RepID=A0A0F7XP68_CHLPN|nr:Uncharacterized protein CPn_0065/CP_0709/CPj0065/CpB0066 [Chlamydia pneumoniae]CRI44404.1 Uncharacterized protein CPn_0065/CP_0709/CPj0065/CpB0066 [Chlamydia pneumoniae]CRI45532.1 Uncharacterized protein CPn_0065/CP_0709/CPj0065/CpB0066 [Chlamydia pneumoniae]CRI47829.1 Uncharacterized protein CPn_0065/CP_0709/CPj0065/CpB0066 [Chlamydia pneumoniae]CRI50080.1 Uncharacterized protein CPn_0065/CP_0709/CPj0065/CpB0066 [Chlamydia pneumoniae]